MGEREEWTVEVYLVIADVSGRQGFVGNGVTDHMMFWNPSRAHEAERYASKCRARGVKAQAVKASVTYARTAP